jgi:hypothetical protein
MLAYWLRHEHRHLFARKTPWLFFHRDHPLRDDNIGTLPREYDETFLDLEERWNMTPDDDGEWPDDDDFAVESLPVLHNPTVMP